MFLCKSNGTKANNLSRLFVPCLALVAVLLAGCGSGPTQNSAPQLVRAGSPDFEKYQQLIKITDLEADESARPIGDIVMTLRATARNFTGRTLNGLEVYAAVVDMEGKPVKERNVLVIPIRQVELENNQAIKVQVLLEGIDKNATRANIKMEVSGFSFK